MSEARPDLPQAPSPPTVVPDLDLVRRIGEGGFGEVWIAVNRTTGQLRAVKLIPLARSSRLDPAGREIGGLTRLESGLPSGHPNLLEIHHVGRTDSHLFCVMELADDQGNTAAPAPESYRPATLESRLAKGPLPPGECPDLARQLLAGLASLHTAGMVHRDVKPGNCLFVRGGLRLADFGLVTLSDPAVSRLGTQRYMPPDGTMDARADVYAAGLVIYEMLTGLPAECFPSLGSRARQVAADGQLAALNRLVLRACDPDPSQRFRNAQEMLAALEACLLPPGRRARWRRWAIAAGVLCVAIVAALVARWSRPATLVEVNFMTQPFEAMILLDDRPVMDSDGVPYRTPCTVPDLPARAHRVVFRHDRLDDLNAGTIDFAEVREVEAQWQP